MPVATAPADQRIEFLPDYCPRCNPAGRHADSRTRLASLTEPYAVTAGRGRWALCRYRCGSCGHTWQRADLWTAKTAGLAA